MNSRYLGRRQAALEEWSAGSLLALTQSRECHQPAVHHPFDTRVRVRPRVRHAALISIYTAVFARPRTTIVQQLTATMRS